MPRYLVTVSIRGVQTIVTAGTPDDAIAEVLDNLTGNGHALLNLSTFTADDIGPEGEAS
jgi:hypothetical protein